MTRLRQLVVALCFLVAITHCHAAIYVSESAGQDSPTCGAAVESACKTLLHAFSRVPSDQDAVLRLQSGTYASFAIPSGRNVIIRSDSNAQSTFITTGGSPGAWTSDGRVFDIADATVEMHDITIRNIEYGTVEEAEVSAGGAVRIHGNSQVHLERCVFDSNILAYNNSHGAALAVAGFASVTAVECDFLRNKAYGGGAITVDNDATLSLDQCTFELNAGISDRSLAGAVISRHRSHITYKGCTFRANTAEYAGAVAHLDASRADITNTLFVDNVAHTSGGAMWAIHTSTGSVDNCVFDKNTVISERDAGGGALMMWSSPWIFTNTNFTRNESPHRASVGAFFRHNENSTYTFEDCVIRDNIVTRQQGTIVIETSTIASFLRVDFINNTATEGSVIILNDFSETSFSNCKFTENSARGSGAIISRQVKKADFDDCVFSGNTAQDNAVFVVEGVASFSACQFERNVAAQSGGVGLFGDKAEVRFELCIFHQNSAADFGGALMFRALNTQTFESCTFQANKARGGGAMHLQSGFACRKCIFSANEARRGGALFFSRDPLISSCEVSYQDKVTFVDNQATVLGGALYWQGGSPTCRDPCETGVSCLWNGNADPHQRAVAYAATRLGATVDKYAQINVFPGRSFDVEVAMYDQFDQRVHDNFDDNGDIVDFSVAMQHVDSDAEDMVLVGQVTIESEDGLAHFSDLEPRGLPSEYVLKITSSYPLLPALSVNLTLNECPARFSPEVAPVYRCIYTDNQQEVAYSRTVRDALVVLSGICMLLVLLTALLVCRYPRNRVFAAAQPAFCYNILAGSFLAYFTVAASYNYPPTQFQCALQPVLGHLGCTLIVASCFAKIRSLVRWHLDRARNGNKNNLHMRTIVASLVCGVALYLGIWMSASPPEPMADISDYNEDSPIDPYTGVGAPAEAYTVCRSSNPAWFWVPAVFESLLITYAVAQTLRTGHLQTPYHERHFIARTLYFTLFVMIVILPMIAFGSLHPETEFALGYFGIFITTTLANCFLFAPKVYWLLTGKEPFTYNEQDEESDRPVIMLPKINVSRIKRPAPLDGAGSGTFTDVALARVGSGTNADPDAAQDDVVFSPRTPRSSVFENQLRAMQMRHQHDGLDMPVMDDSFEIGDTHDLSISESSTDGEFSLYDPESAIPETGESRLEWDENDDADNASSAQDHFDANSQDYHDDNGYYSDGSEYEEQLP
jgi:7 transmembrane sweet-taste receptor of 3 GCPR/Right handed beta helix region